MDEEEGKDCPMPAEESVEEVGGEHLRMLQVSASVSMQWMNVSTAEGKTIDCCS